MTEEEFYKLKIFNKISLNVLKREFPNQSNTISLWYKSDRYNIIQNYKSFLTNKLKQIKDNRDVVNFTSEQLYCLFQWWENTPKICYYCSLPENALEELHKQPNHINKRYPKRGKSLEIDRKRSHLSYSNIENLVLACYWCNNAKTDTFTEEEFSRIGEVIKGIWETRLGYAI